MGWPGGGARGAGGLPTIVAVDAPLGYYVGAGRSALLGGSSADQASRGRSCGRLGLVVTDDERERAWAAVHDALARMPGWAVGPCVFHGDDALWHVAAIDLRPRGRYAKREAITATGATEIAALRALVTLLEARQVSPDPPNP